MSFADPSVITIAGTPHSLVRIKQDGYDSEYRLTSATESFVMLVRNTSYKRKGDNVVIYRHNVDLTHTVFAVAPATIPTIRHCYFILENQQGDTLTDPVNDAIGLLNFLTATSGAMLTKLTNMES